MFFLRTKILGIQTLAITSTVIILGALSYTLMVDALLTVQQHNLEHLAVTSAHNINRNLTDLQDKFRNILISRGLHRGSDLPMAKYLAKHQEQFPELSLLNREGREELGMSQHRIVGPNKLRDWSSTNIFNQAMSRPNEVVISPVVENQELGTPTITLAMAQVQYFGDEFQGMLIGSTPVSEVLAQTGMLGHNDGGGLVVIDTEQRVLHFSAGKDTHEPLAQATSIVESSLLETIRSSSSGFLEKRFLDQDAYIAYLTDPLSGWTVLAILPSDVFMTPLNRLRKITGITCLALLMGGLFVALGVTNRLTRDIGHLTEHTQKIAAGDLNSRVAVTSQDEVAVLGEAFNEMTDRLARSQEARDRLDTILQSIIDPLLVTDAEGRIRRYNDAAMEMLQCDHDDIQGAEISRIFTEEPCPGSDISLLTLAREAPLQNHETCARTCTGKEVPVLLSCSYVSMATEQESGLVVILKDISMRKRTEEALNLALAAAEAAHDQIDAILRSVVDGLIVTDTNQKIVLMNRAAEKLFGIKLQQVLYKPVESLISNQVALDHLTKQLDRPDPEQETDFEINRAEDDTLRIIKARSAPVKSKEGLTKGLITTLQDVTEERNTEKIKNEFISTAAHELNTPLTTIMGFTELLIAPDSYGGFTDTQRQEFLVEILEKSDVLARIVSDLLDLSRMESGQAMPLQKALTDLDETIHKAIRRYKVSDNSHEFVLELAESAVSGILVDQQRIIQVLENLISNAVKYSPSGSRIVISTRRNGDYALVSIADQGVGMTEEQVARVFDKFYRADASNTAIDGLGMGMSIVQNIILAHDGTIDISSVPGVGTTVTFSLPLSSPVSLQ